MNEMSDFSQLPQTVLEKNQEKGFVGMHIMQGVPILDRDLNLLQDLITATMRGLVSRYIGNGVPLKSDAFAIQQVNAVANDFQITAGPPGICLVNGIEVNIAATVNYSAQGAFGPMPVLTTPQGSARKDTVYLDVFLESVDDDDMLGNDEDVAVQTSVRLRPAWVVRVAQGGGIPDAPSGHTNFLLAEINRPAGEPQIKTAMISDLRTRCLTLDTVLQLLVRPEITGFSPGSGAATASITIKGRRLDLMGTPTIRFGDIPVSPADVSGLLPESVTVKVPAGGTPGSKVKVSLTNGAGTATSAALFEFI
jgi:IPT/TIG domain